ncbi:hypothetical protein SEA_RASPUTIA_106 [Microbacterium phage Rasputia]|nr:hypothetical protein SEA_RASPUTIA_106 [Microbacterium phage Rasputia]
MSNAEGPMTPAMAIQQLKLAIDAAVHGQTDSDLLEEGDLGVYFEVDEVGETHINISVEDQVEDGKTVALQIVIKEGWVTP